MKSPSISCRWGEDENPAYKEGKTVLNISEILTATSGQWIQGDVNALVKGFSIDTRTLRPGDLFVGLKGEHCADQRLAGDANGQDRAFPQEPSWNGRPPMMSAEDRPIKKRVMLGDEAFDPHGYPAPWRGDAEKEAPLCTREQTCTRS